MIMHKPNRRVVLGGGFASPRSVEPNSTVLHVSSAVITVLPAHRESVLQRLSSLSNIEVHHAEAFKIVIVLEAPEADEMGTRLAEIATWNGVLSANMVFEQIEHIRGMGD